MVEFHPKSSIPDLSGRVYFITGGTMGLGAGTIKLLAAQNPSHIYFSGRSQSASKAESVISEVNKINKNVQITFVPMDLTSLASIQDAIKSFLARTEVKRLDVLMLNAGVMCSPAGTTKDGYEVQFGTNHIGHALIVKLLLPLLQQTAAAPGSDVRIISLSSTAYSIAPPIGNAIDFSTLKSSQSNIGPLGGIGVIPLKRYFRYGQSKLANLLYARALAERYPAITSVSVHPGYIKTDLFRSMSWLDTLPAASSAYMHGGWTEPEQGPWNQTWAATAPKQQLRNGAYYEPVGKEIEKLETSAAQDTNGKLCEELWQWTERELQPWMDR